MGWFNKKEEKKEETSQNTQAPQFKSEFPRYESGSKPAEDINKHREALADHTDMPPLKRPPTLQSQPQPIMRPQPMMGPGSEKVLVRRDALPFPQPMYQAPPRAVPQQHIPMIKHENIPIGKEHPSTLRPSLIDKGRMPEEAPLKQGKTIFVKVGQYEEAMEKINAIMSQIDNAEDTISKLEKLREQEVQEIQTWKKELEDIKTRLKSVDMTLFGR